MPGGSRAAPTKETGAHLLGAALEPPSFNRGFAAGDLKGWDGSVGIIIWDYSWLWLALSIAV